MPDMAPLRPVTRPRLYEQVAQQILEWVRENDLHVGDRLPPERELATRLGVSRATVSQALVAMEVVRRTDADLARIDAALEVMAKDIAAGGRGVEGDELFHAAVTTAGHSALLQRLMGEISELVKETRIESLSQPERPRESLEGHRRIAAAIRERDAAAATEAMRDHVERVSDVALLRD
jgi:GntR family transcriptional repressor for pyruvate dehydrogenase complex